MLSRLSGTAKKEIKMADKVRKKFDPGFTLIEVLVSMALMAGVVMGSMTYFYMGSSAQFDARLNEFVLNMQEDILEQRLSMPYLASEPVEDRDLGTVEAYGTVFNRRFIASEAKSHLSQENEAVGLMVGSERYKDMTVEVTWDDPSSGAPKVMEMRTIMSPRGHD